MGKAFKASPGPLVWSRVIRVQVTYRCCCTLWEAKLLIMEIMIHLLKHIVGGIPPELDINIRVTNWMTR